MAPHGRVRGAEAGAGRPPERVACPASPGAPRVLQIGRVPVLATPTAPTSAPVTLMGILGPVAVSRSP